MPVQTLSRCRFGLVGSRTKNTASFFAIPLVIVYFDIDYVNNAKAVNYWRNRSRSVCISD